MNSITSVEKNESIGENQKLGNNDLRQSQYPHYINSILCTITSLLISFFLLLGGEYFDIISNITGYILWPILFGFIYVLLKYKSKGIKKNKIFTITLIVMLGFCIVKSNNLSEENYYDMNVAEKPVIYLYPESKQEVEVVLDYNGKIIADYPEYDEKIKGWKVIADTDSTITDIRDGKQYSYLFWEGEPVNKIDWDLSMGFIVEGKDAREFLQEKLDYMGMTPKEYNEFIVYWYPRMMSNKYNLIHFAQEKYISNAPLYITPKPDSMLRVFMLMKPLDEKINIVPQKLQTFERKGFAVIEWGGAELE